MGLPRIVVSALLHASIAQLVEHRSRKAGVISSILVAGTMISQVAALCGYFLLLDGDYPRIFVIRSSQSNLCETTALWWV